MDSLNDLLQNKNPSQPPQVTALKKYAKENHGIDMSVRVSSKHYLITAPNAAIAHKLRVETVMIIQQCNLDKRLVIHIGS